MAIVSRLSSAPTAAALLKSLLATYPTTLQVTRQTTQYPLGHFHTLDREGDQESNGGSIAGYMLSTASNCITCLNQRQHQMIANAYFHPLFPIPGNKLVASTYFFTGVSSLSGHRYIIYTESLRDEGSAMFPTNAPISFLFCTNTAMKVCQHSTNAMARSSGLPQRLSQSQTRI